MPAELLVVLAAGLVVLQMAFVVLRKTWRDERSYLILLGADLAALVTLHALGRDGSFNAYVAVVAAGLLTLTPRLLERREGLAAARGDLLAARRWAVLREWIVPGRASTLRRRQLDDLIEVHEEGSQQVVRRLRDALLHTEDPHKAEALHEELVAMLLADQRFSEATEHFARHLGPAFLAHRPALLPQLVHAYGELGQIDAAAALVTMMEAGPLARDPSLFPLLQRARLVLLAYAGWDRALAPLLDGPAGFVLHPKEREHLLRVARARAISAAPPSAELEMALRVASMRADEVRVRPRKLPLVTYALIAVNVLAYLASGSLGDDAAALVRAGALFRPAVFAGEWWRAVSAMFLHGGIWHIAINMYGLYILGPFVEALIGSVPFFAIYFFAGLTGAGASLLVGRGELSVGASGAIMGVLGAIIVLVVLRRGNFPDRWRRVMLWNLAILVAVQIGIDFASPMIDNAAHIGGMIGGAIATLLFAPGLLTGGGRLGRALSGAAAVAFVAVAVVALVQVVRTPLADTLARLPQKVVQVRGVQLTVPREWEVDAKNGKLVDPELDLEITVSPTGVESQQQGDPRFRSLLDRVERSARPR